MQYENPHDISVAAYLYIIRNEYYYEDAAKFVLADKRPNWFWTRKIARRYLQPTKQAS